MSDADKRSSTRQDVKWEAMCERAGEFLSGHILDVSSGGVFFQPDNDILVGESLFEVLRNVQRYAEDEELVLTFTIGPHQPAVRKEVVLRWRGHNSRHDCNGLGLRFNGEESAAA